MSIVATLIGPPMSNGRVIDKTPIELGVVRLDCLLDIGESMFINGNEYTVYERSVSLTTEGAGVNSDIKSELKYGLGQHYTIALTGRQTTF